jgi:mono/diheme cytochrome c family protein
MQHCADCHGETGGGDGPKADPKNTPRAFAKLSGDSAATDAYRFEVVRRGAVDDGMPAFADVTVQASGKLDQVDHLRIR